MDGWSKGFASSLAVIRVRRGKLELTASHEIAVRDLARYFEVSIEGMIERISTKTNQEIAKEKGLTKET